MIPGNMLIPSGITRCISFQLNSYGNSEASEQTDEHQNFGHDLQPCSGKKVCVIHKKVVCVF